MGEKEAGLPESTLSVVIAFNSKQNKKKITLSNPEL